jgi:hypothetical protein
MKLNADKCKVLKIKHRSKEEIAYDFSLMFDGNNCTNLENVSEMKDLGVIVDSELSFGNHIYDKINKAYQMLGIIKRNFCNINKEVFMLLYKGLVRSQLEYANSVWNPYKVSLIRDLEKVQKRATKIVGVCKKLPYGERLRLLNLPTLRFRRIRGDMIEVYKIVTGNYDARVSPVLPRNLDSRTRGNSYKFLHVRAKYDIRKFNFCSRIVNYWNSLPDAVVNSVSLNSFKNSLDKFWSNENLVFDWEENISGVP